MWIFNFYEITVNKLFFGYQIFIRQISHITPNNHYFGLFRQEKGPSYSPVILTFGGGAALNKSAHYGYERALINKTMDYWLYPVVLLVSKTMRQTFFKIRSILKKKIINIIYSIAIKKTHYWFHFRYIIFYYFFF